VAVSSMAMQTTGRRSAVSAAFADLASAVRKRGVGPGHGTVAAIQEMSLRKSLTQRLSDARRRACADLRAVKP
jgi:hypothetical protein